MFLFALTFSAEAKFVTKMIFVGCMHDCQIFLDTMYQNGEKYTKLSQHYKMTAKYTKRPVQLSK
jgi:uncharacterized radical SAM superfamily Fe-S cluster-containing enzyme